MKKLLMVVLALMIMSSAVVVNAQSTISVVIDGKNVVFPDALPFINEDNRTLVPLRAIGEAMGLDVNWIGPENKAVFSKTYTSENSPFYEDYDDDGVHDAYLGHESVTFTIGEKTAIHSTSWFDISLSPENDFPDYGGISEIQMDTAPINKDSRTFAPVRYLAEAFRYNVNWDGTTNSVNLNYMCSVYELGIQTELVAGWEEYQGWMFTSDEDSELQSIEIISVTIDNKDYQFSVLTQEDKNTIYESGDDYGKYLGGFVVNHQMEANKYYSYRVKFLAVFSDGTKKLGFADIGYYYDGGQGGYI